MKKGTIKNEKVLRLGFGPHYDFVSFEDLCMFRSTAIEMTVKAENENDKRDSCPVHMMVGCERYEGAKAVTKRP